MMTNNMKPYELNEQEMNEVTAGFIEPAPTDEEMIQKLWEVDTQTEADQIDILINGGW